MKVLIDADVFLDVILNKEPFIKQSLNALSVLIEKESGYVSVQTLRDIFYWCSKDNRIPCPRQIIEKISFVYGTIDVTSEDSMNAQISKVKDYGKGLMVASAKRNGIDSIVTRDQREYYGADIVVLHPGEVDKYFEEGMQTEECIIDNTF